MAADTVNGTSNIECLLTEKHILLKFFNIYYRPSSCKNGKLILKNVSGQFESGRLTAILGPSGAGKTSLLDVLSGFKSHGVKGTILVNGEQLKTKEFRKISSYIPQDFAMLDHLSAYETLKFAADFKLKSTGVYKKEDVIKNIIKILNLEKCKHTLLTHLSGGEQKRLSIGVELITNPPVMFFDEPTSGLDSVASIQVITHLKQLAHDGRAVICVVHQPSSRLLKFFDDVLVLSEGECIYNGPLDHMVKAFAVAGFNCPNFYNRADFALEIASKDHCGNLDALISTNHKKVVALESVTVVDSSEITKATTTAEHNGSIKRCYLKCNRRKFPVNFYMQFYTLFKRSLLATYRNWLCTQMRIIIHALVGFLLGIVYWDIGSDASKLISNSSCLFFIVLFTYFANSMPTILLCPLETSVFLREHLNGWYSVRAYYLAKFLADLPIQIMCPTIFCGLAYYLTGQPDDYWRYFMFWTICVLTCVEGQSVGLFIGSVCSLQMSIFLVPATSIPMLIFCGYFIRASELSSFLHPLTYVSYFRYSVEGLAQAVYGYNRTDLVCSSQPYCYYHKPEKFLKDMEMDGDRFGIDVVVLIGWISLFQLCFLLSLYFKVRRSK